MSRRERIPPYLSEPILRRDYFIRVVYGTRISLAVGFFASIIVLVIGMIVGSIAGYAGGIVGPYYHANSRYYLIRCLTCLMVILLASVLRLTLAATIEGTC